MHNNINPYTQIKGPREYASYRIHKSNAMTSSHEQAQANPLLQGAKNHTFQHPTVTRDVCNDVSCEKKICNTPCGTVERSSHVAHTTHDGTFPGAVFLAQIDLKNKNSDQHAIIYQNPVPNADIYGVHTDQKMTANLNNNKTMLSEIHKNVKPDNLKDFDIQAQVQKVNNENIN